jgi:flagellar hook-associated protein 3 FlgL
MIYRVSTFGTHELSIYNAMNTQSRLQEGLISSTTGMKSQDYAGLSVDARRLLSMESTVSRINAYERNISSVERRLQAMETNVSQMHDIASEAKTLLVNALNAEDSEELQIDDRASDMLEQVAGLLNLKFEERYLFAGSRTNVEPIDLSGFDPTDAGYDPNNPTPANAGYYTGDTVTPTARIDEAMTLDYGVTGAEPSFERLIRGLQLAQNAGTPGAIDKPTLEQALDLINEAVRDIPDVRGKIGADLKTLESMRDKQEQLSIYAEETISQTESADPAATMTRIVADQVLLEASYSVTSRLAQLSLANYLR